MDTGRLRIRCRKCDMTDSQNALAAVPRPARASRSARLHLRLTAGAAREAPASGWRNAARAERIAPDRERPPQPE